MENKKFDFTRHVTENQRISTKNMGHPISTSVLHKTIVNLTELLQVLIYYLALTITSE